MLNYEMLFTSPKLQNLHVHNWKYGTIIIAHTAVHLMWFDEATNELLRSTCSPSMLLYHNYIVLYTLDLIVCTNLANIAVKLGIAKINTECTCDIIIM